MMLLSIMPDLLPHVHLLYQTPPILHLLENVSLTYQRASASLPEKVNDYQTKDMRNKYNDNGDFVIIYCHVNESCKTCINSYMSKNIYDLLDSSSIENMKSLELIHSLQQKW